MDRTNTWVLGATGYVGSAVMHNLLTAHIREEMITPIVHKALPPPEFEGCNTLTGALETFDFDWFNRFPPTALIHAARIAGGTPKARQKAAVRGAKANEKWFHYLTRFAEPIPTVYVSGTLMYGNLPPNVMANEGWPLSPLAFAAHYHNAEVPFEQAKGIRDVRMVRPAWILGPDSWFFHFFYRPALETGVVPIYGTGEQLMSLIHIQDCGGLIVHALRCGSPNTNYNIFAAPPITQREFSTIVAESMGLKVAKLLGNQGRVKGEAFAALTSNIPVCTMHQDWFDSYCFQFPTVAFMVEEVLGQLQQKEQKKFPFANTEGD